MVQHFTIPLTEEAVRSLKVGDFVSLSGIIYTGRDAVHAYLYKGGKLPDACNWKDSVLYHCGPVMLKQADGSYRCLGAGPTTSSREEPYEYKIIADYGLRAIIGKGGMGSKTVEACKKHGCVYLHAVGGAAQVYADTIQKVRGVYLDQFGLSEAVWVLEVENFTATVTIDTHGNSLHQNVLEASKERLKELLTASKPK